MKKLARTISGVTPVAVMTRPGPCPGHCLYCPTYSGVPQSYTPTSPAVLRAIKSEYDVRKQIEFRLQTLTEMGHPVDKVELIVMGGTFLATDIDYQYSFIKECYDALNGQKSASLEEAKKFNETASHRCTGLCIETRPDFCGVPEVERMLDFGTTRVELGVQMLDDDIYRLVRRGHTVADVIDATALLRKYGLKVHYHWMPGLPGSSPEHDLELTRLLFADSRFVPDGLKLYPTMVIEGTELEKWYEQGKYQPYDYDTMVNLLIRMKMLVPKYVRISRVLRDIPSKYIKAGLKDSLRFKIKERMQEGSLSCRCIRCREYGHRVNQGLKTGEPELVRLDYEASGGKEIFLSFEDKNETLFGLSRLRIQPEDNKYPAIIRELHVYGPEVALNQRQAGTVQHHGLGKGLMKEAERIAFNECGATRLAVLSGVGARQYYSSEFGYTLEGAYMVKTNGNQPCSEGDKALLTGKF